MPFRVETVMLAPGTEQYAGRAQEDRGIGAIVAAARQVEALGFDGATVPEAGHDPFLPLVLAAEHTKRITLGTNVAVAFPRSPMVTAQLAWDLQRLSGGRFLLGIGTQVRVHVERRFASEWKEPPGPRLRDYVLCLKAMFESFQAGGKPKRFDGEHYRFDLLPTFFNPGPIAHPQVPIYLAAVNPYAARLAGEHGDGLRLHPVATFGYARDVIVPAISEGAAKAGRSRSSVDLVAAPFLATAPDEESLEVAKKGAKQHIAFYAATRAYHRVLAHHGWEAFGEEVNARTLAGRNADLGELVGDDMLEEWAIVATWDGLVEKVRERCAGTFDTVLLDLPAGLREQEDRVREIVAALRRP